jgi:hypothetical protein
MSVLIYGSETWKTTEGDKKNLDTFQNRCLRQLLKVGWPDKTSNEELHRRARTTKASETIKGRKWKWIGHVLRMDNTMYHRTDMATRDKKESCKNKNNMEKDY